MQLSTYNGWENKFTWLVHLHLSNEADMMNEITELVASEPNEGSAGSLVEMWVKVNLDNWFTFFPGRNKKRDEEMRLLAWDLLGSALAYADWVQLIHLLIGEAEVSENLFTMTLFRSVMNSGQLQQDLSTLVSEASSIYTGADAVKDWFELQLETWITTPAARQHKNSPLSLLSHALVWNTYAVIYWEHVARAFRDAY